MAHRRRVEAPSGLRAALAADLRQTHDRIGHGRLVADPDWPGQAKVVRRPGPSQSSRLADDLDAGKPVIVHGYQVCQLVPGIDDQGWARVEPDGSVTPIVAYHRKDGVTDWKPAHG